MAQGVERVIGVASLNCSAADPACTVGGNLLEMSSDSFAVSVGNIVTASCRYSLKSCRGAPCSACKLRAF